MLSSYPFPPLVSFLTLNRGLPSRSWKLTVSLDQNRMISSSTLTLTPKTQRFFYLLSSMQGPSQASNEVPSGSSTAAC